MVKSQLLAIIVVGVGVSCTKSSSSNDTTPPRVESTLVDSIPTQAVSLPKQQEISALEKQMIGQGLVDVQEVAPDIRVELKYSTTDNFVKKDVYGELTRAYLQPAIAKKLAKASEILKRNHPDHSLLIYDAARPNSVQYLLWDALDALNIPRKSKPQYVADPKIGSIHNFGCAVDLTVANAEGVPLDMGTPYDFFGPLAYPRMESQLLREGKLTTRQVANRNTLRQAMTQAGFSVNPTEWWHFDGMSRNAAKARYGMIK